MKRDRKIKYTFMIHPQTLEAMERLVPTGNRSEFIDHLIARQLGVERDIMKIINETPEKNTEKTLDTH